jgi:chitin disaccharide deacetylase
MLSLNADDLGLNEKVTDRILFCYNQKRIYSASAMVFMQDSDRAANLAKENQLPIGLHINFDQGLTARTMPKKLRDHHRAVAGYLKAKKWNQVIYNPFLRNSFDYVFQSQWDEFWRLYDQEPKRLDGHHHMHLCMNMLFSGKLPIGIRIRRNFTFFPGEKNPVNRLYRYLVDRWLQSRFVCTDYFFSMKPISSEKLKKILLLSKTSDVELMVHPGVNEEYEFLLSPEWERLLNDEH